MKNIKYIVFGLILFLFLNIDVYATPITCTRTDNDLKLPERAEGILEVYPEAKENVLKTPCVDSSQRIYDFKNVLGEKEESKLKKELIEYKKETKLDAVIVITDDIGDFTLVSYAYKFYEYNDFSKNGIIFVIYFDNDKTRIFMGKNGNPDDKVFEVYKDSRVNAILKYVFQHNIKKKDYYEACKNYNTLTKEMYFRTTGNYNVDSSGKVVMDIPWIECIVLSLSIAFIIFVLFITKYGVKIKRNNLMFKNSLDNENMIIKCEYDKPYVETNE